MSSFLQLSLLLAVILITARLAGYISNRLGQPSVLGELIAGLILGPSLLNITHLNFVADEHIGEIIHLLGEMGVLLLMFLAGLELHLSDLARNTRVSAFAGVLGVLVPVGLGFVAGELLGYDLTHSLFLGLTLGATSVSISAQTLIELGKLRSRVGLGLLGAAVFDDILVILLLSVSLAALGGGSGVTAILLIVGRMALFIALSIAFGLYILPRIVSWFSKLPISFGLITFAIVIVLFYGVAAEIIGSMAAITGSFVAGLMFSRTPEKNLIEEGLQALSYAFFVPIFFVTIGLNIDIKQLGLGALWALLIISVIGILGKIVGAGAGALLAKFSTREALQLGIGMVSRGEVGLIVAQVGLTQGAMDESIFSAVVGVVLVTTLLTPPLLRASFRTGTDPEPQHLASNSHVDEEAI